MRKSTPRKYYLSFFPPTAVGSEFSFPAPILSCCDVLWRTNYFPLFSTSLLFMKRSRATMITEGAQAVNTLWWLSVLRMAENGWHFLEPTMTVVNLLGNVQCRVRVVSSVWFVFSMPWVYLILAPIWDATFHVATTWSSCTLFHQGSHEIERKSQKLSWASTEWERTYHSVQILDIICKSPPSPSTKAPHQGWGLQNCWGPAGLAGPGQRRQAGWKPWHGRSQLGDLPVWRTTSHHASCSTPGGHGHRIICSTILCG